jgi:hypothetical protein
MEKTMSNCVPKTVSILFAAVGLVACGGGGGSPVPPPVQSAPSPPPPSSPPPSACATNPPPEGFQPFATAPAAVGGTIADRSNPSFILMNVPAVWQSSPGQYARVMAYGPDLAASSVIGGHVYSENSWCSDSNAVWYNGWDSGSAGGRVFLRTSIDASVPTVSGSIRYASASYSLGGGPLPGAASTYTFWSAARLADVEGSWDLAEAGGRMFKIAVAADGSLTGNYRGCDVSGTLRPDASGVGQFDLWFAPLESMCPGLAGRPYAGAVLPYPLQAGGWQALLWAFSTDYWDLWDEVAAIGRR